MKSLIEVKNPQKKLKTTSYRWRQVASRSVPFLIISFIRNAASIRAFIVQ